VSGPTRFEIYDAIIEKMNRKHAVIMVGGKVAVMTEGWESELKRSVLDFSRVSDMQTFYAEREIKVGDKSATVFSDWARHPNRRQYEGMSLRIFNPRLF
jgi:hypothetical protein